MKKRIWELDAARGLCILGMVVVHCVFDAVELYRLVQWDYPAFYNFIQNWGGVLFLLISGICVTLGSRSTKRGILVFSCGMLVTAVTAGMYWLGLADKGIIIYFGVLHCLGICMLLWPLFQKMPPWALAVLGLILAAAGLWLQDVRVDTFLLVPLGLRPRIFLTGDYFPLLPNLGFFLLGAFLGRTVYEKKESLLPNVNENNPVLRFLQLVGKHSLLIYLLHQPILSGIFYGILLLR